MKKMKPMIKIMKKLLIMIKNNFNIQILTSYYDVNYLN